MSVRVNTSSSASIHCSRLLDGLGLSQSSHSAKFDLPEWIRGKWFTIGTNAINSQTVEINSTQLIIKNSVDQTIVHDLKLTQDGRQSTSNTSTFYVSKANLSNNGQWKMFGAGQIE